MRKIRKGDEVIVTAGRDKGKRGTVAQVRPDNRLVVEGVQVVKRHTKPNPNQGVGGGIVEREATIHRSNVSLYNPAAGKGDRVGIRTLEDGKRVRFFRSNGEVVDI